MCSSDLCRATRNGGQRPGFYTLHEEISKMGIIGEALDNYDAKVKKTNAEWLNRPSSFVLEDYINLEFGKSELKTAPVKKTAQVKKAVPVKKEAAPKKTEAPAKKEAPKKTAVPAKNKAPKKAAVPAKKEAAPKKAAVPAKKEAAPKKAATKK